MGGPVWPQDSGLRTLVVVSMGMRRTWGGIRLYWKHSLLLTFRNGEGSAQEEEEGEEEGEDEREDEREEGEQQSFLPGLVNMVSAGTCSPHSSGVRPCTLRLIAQMYQDTLLKLKYRNVHYK